MKSIDELLKIASKTDITVLIQGESGTGKEVAARKLHKESSRRSGPFIALNCGAIAKNLIESTLEGAKRGAYTGASTEQIGLVRAANGGTLFLDEIGELPFECQSRLLRILQERVVLPIGATHPIPVNFRLICATNRNLKDEVFNGNFREDLFFRLNVFPIQLPPLRERIDFEIIAQQLWNEANQNAKVSLMDQADLSPTEISLLHLFNWPGNIRQLQNVLQRYSLLKPHGIKLNEILDAEYSEPLYPITACHEPQIHSVTPEWKQIAKTIQKCNGNKVQAAKLLGISRSNLYLQIKKASLFQQEAG